jgi:hypothetical protein
MADERYGAQVTPEEYMRLIADRERQSLMGGAVTPHEMQRTVGYSESTAGGREMDPAQRAAMDALIERVGELAREARGRMGAQVGTQEMGRYLKPSVPTARFEDVGVAKFPRGGGYNY